MDRRALWTAIAPERNIDPPGVVGVARVVRDRDLPRAFAQRNASRRVSRHVRDLDVDVAAPQYSPSSRQRAANVTQLSITAFPGSEFIGTAGAISFRADAPSTQVGSPPTSPA